ncbi:hypothetical protein ACFL4W_03985 [Planctomycetota bacterium]
MRDSAQDIVVWILIIALAVAVFLLKGYIILGVPGLIVLVLSILMVCSDPQPFFAKMIAYSLAGWSLLYISSIISLRFNFSGQPGDFDVIFIWVLLNTVGLPLAVLSVIAWHILIVKYRKGLPGLSGWDCLS